VIGEETVVLKEWEGREPQPFHELEQVTFCMVCDSLP
jgi:hypothetical protein